MPEESHVSQTQSCANPLRAGWDPNKTAAGNATNATETPAAAETQGKWKSLALSHPREQERVLSV